MSEIKIKVPSGIPEKIAKFELEKELSRKKRKMKSIKSSVKKLDLSEEDVKKFEKATEEKHGNRGRKNCCRYECSYFCSD